MKRGLLNVQYWPGDRDQMMRVAQLIADIEPRKREEYDVMFSARFDAKHDVSMINRIATKFDCFTCKTRTAAIGWPAGCNYLWLESMHEIYRRIKAGTLPHYKWVLTLENDDCPLTKDWLDRLHEVFTPLNMNVVGALIPHLGPHINGNCMFGTNPEFMDFILKIKRLPNTGWDLHLAPQFRMYGWADIPEIRSIWGTSNLQDPHIQEFVRIGTKMLHGVKDDSVIRWARANLVGKAG
jgi:hypothetical protein